MEWRKCIGMFVFIGITIGAWWAMVSLIVMVWDWFDPTL